MDSATSAYLVAIPRIAVSHIQTRRTGASPVNSQRDAGNVADADCGRKCGRKRLEVGDVAGAFGIIVAAGGNRDAMAEMPKLDKPEAQRKERARPDEGDNHEGNGRVPHRNPRLPYEYPDGSDDVFESFHYASLGG